MTPPEKKAGERAIQLINTLDEFITRDGEWDTELKAEEAIVAAFVTERKEALKGAAKIANSFADLYSNEPNHISQRTANAIAQAICELAEKK